jgi:pimeloyl-ACP methyl ester carboxylesterase
MILPRRPPICAMQLWGLGWNRPIVLGHSMGAMTALMLAGLYPSVPRAIVLEDPPGQWLPADRTLAGDDPIAPMRAWFLGVKRKTREELLAEQRAAPHPWPEAELGPWADAKIQVSERVLRIFEPNAGPVVDWAAALPKITCPALLLTADLDRGAALTPTGAGALRAQVPQLQVAHIAGAGHNIRRDQFDAFIATVRPFLHTVLAQA